MSADSSIRGNGLGELVSEILLSILSILQQTGQLRALANLAASSKDFLGVVEPVLYEKASMYYSHHESPDAEDAPWVPYADNEVPDLTPTIDLPENQIVEGLLQRLGGSPPRRMPKIKQLDIIKQRCFEYMHWCHYLHDTVPWSADTHYRRKIARPKILRVIENLIPDTLVSLKIDNPLLLPATGLARQAGLRYFDIDIGEIDPQRITDLLTTLSPVRLEGLAVRNIGHMHTSIIDHLIGYFPTIKTLELDGEAYSSLRLKGQDYVCTKATKDRKLPLAPNLRSIALKDIREINYLAEWLEEIGQLNTVRVVDLEGIGQRPTVPTDSNILHPLKFERLTALNSLSLIIIGQPSEAIDNMLLNCAPLQILRLQLVSNNRMAAENAVLRHTGLKQLWLEVRTAKGKQLNMRYLTPTQMEEVASKSVKPFPVNRLGELTELREVALMAPLCDLLIMPMLPNIRCLRVLNYPVFPNSTGDGEAEDTTEEIKSLAIQIGCLGDPNTTEVSHKEPVLVGFGSRRGFLRENHRPDGGFHPPEINCDDDYDKEIPWHIVKVDIKGAEKVGSLISINDVRADYPHIHSFEVDTSETPSWIRRRHLAEFI